MKHLAFGDGKRMTTEYKTTTGELPTSLIQYLIHAQQRSNVSVLFFTFSGTAIGFAGRGDTIVSIVNGRLEQTARKTHPFEEIRTLPSHRSFFLVSFKINP